MANSSSNQNDKKKKPSGFFSEISKSINDVMSEVKADLNAMTPPSREAEKKKAELNAKESAMAAMLSEATHGFAEETVDEGIPAASPAPASQPAQEAAPASAGLPPGNLWQALADPAVSTRLHGDACFYALIPADVDNYRKAIAQEKAAPFTLGIVAVNLQAPLEDETPETRADDLLLQALLKALEEPRLYGAVGAGPRQLWHDLDLLDERLTNLLNTHPKLIAIGPIGIDEPFAPYAVQQQQEQFALQLDLAADFGLPAILTHRNSLSYMTQALEEAERLPPLIWLPPLNSAEEAAIVQKFGMHTVFSPEVTLSGFPSQFLSQQPIEKLLLASGSALVAPQGFQGHFNQPKFLLNSLQASARMLGEKQATVLNTTNYNLAKLFQKG